jgi:hypothetical protein
MNKEINKLKEKSEKLKKEHLEIELQIKKIELQKDLLEVKIKKIELQKDLLEVKKKYEGKFWYFEFDSGDLFMYSHCIEVIGLNVGLFNVLEFSHSNSEFKFITKNKFSFNLCQTKITKEGFYSKINELKNELNKL